MNSFIDTTSFPEPESTASVQSLYIIGVILACFHSLGSVLLLFKDCMSEQKIRSSKATAQFVNN